MKAQVWRVYFSSEHNWYLEEEEAQTLLLSPHISPSLTSVEKSAPTLFTFSVCFPAGPGLVNLLPWFQLRGLSRDTPCLRWVVVGVGVILSCYYQAELTHREIYNKSESSLRQLGNSRPSLYISVTYIDTYNLEETWAPTSSDWVLIYRIRQKNIDNKNNSYN